MLSNARPDFSCHLRDNTGNFADSGFGGAWETAKKGTKSSFLRANSLRILTGNYLRSCRELNRAIREVSAAIRESAFVRYFGIRPLVTIRSSRQISNVA